MRCACVVCLGGWVGAYPFWKAVLNLFRVMDPKMDPCPCWGLGVWQGWTTDPCPCWGLGVWQGASTGTGVQSTGIWADDDDDDNDKAEMLLLLLLLISSVC